MTLSMARQQDGKGGAGAPHQKCPLRSDWYAVRRTADEDAGELADVDEDEAMTSRALDFSQPAR